MVMRSNRSSNRRLFVVLAGLLISLNGQWNASGSPLDCCSAEAIDVGLYNRAQGDTGRSLNKPEYVASKLGIVNGESAGHVRSLVGKFCASLTLPAMVSTYYTALIMSKDEDYGFDLSLPQRLAFSALVSAVTYFILDSLGEYVSNKSGDKIAIVHDFILNWPTHKAGTPEELQALFDGLHMEYLNNGQRIIMSEIFADEVMRKVAGVYIASLATKELGN